MAIVAMFDASSLPLAAYDEIVAEAGPRVWDQPARSHHVCMKDGAGFRVVDVWDSAEAFARFGSEIIGPAVAAAGYELTPQVYEVRNVHPAPDAVANLANVATVAAMYEAFGRGDIPAILEYLADDVDWEAGRADDHGIPWLRPGRGKDHVLSFFATLHDVEFKRFEPTTITGAGEVVVAVIELEAVVKSTGRTVDDLEVHVWTFGADGQVRSLRHVVDTVAHRAAVAD